MHLEEAEEEVVVMGQVPLADLEAVVGDALATVTAPARRLQEQRPRQPESRGVATLNDEPLHSASLSVDHVLRQRPWVLVGPLPPVVPLRTADRVTGDQTDHGHELRGLEVQEEQVSRRATVVVAW